MFKIGEVISYLIMCNQEGVNLQRGMNFRLRGKTSVILMSLRRPILPGLSQVWTAPVWPRV